MAEFTPITKKFGKDYPLGTLVDGIYAIKPRLGCASRLITNCDLCLSEGTSAKIGCKLPAERFDDDIEDISERYAEFLKRPK